MQKLKNNEARPKFTGSYKKKKACIPFGLTLTLANASINTFVICVMKGLSG